MSLATTTAQDHPTRYTSDGVLILGHVTSPSLGFAMTALDQPENWDRPDKPTVRPAATGFSYLRVELHDDLGGAGVPVLASMMGYLWRSVMHVRSGDELGVYGDDRDYHHSDSSSVTFYAPSGDIRSSRPHFALARFHEDLAEYFEHGTPARKDGSSLIDGFGRPVTFSVWLDEVEVVNA